MATRPQVLMTPEKIKSHAEILSNRVKKRYTHLSKRFKKEGIECFRLYDWDIPEVRAVVDWYGGHLVVGEYIRWQTGPDWLPQMAEAVARALGVPLSRTHIKHRRTNTKEGLRYKQLSQKGERFIAGERDLKFWINCDDYLDTGLFSDHRETRMIVRNMSRGHDFLNLYAYTGAFTCAAAAGGANSTVTVDRNATYVKWAQDNLKLNGLEGDTHMFVQLDVSKFLERVKKQGRRYTLAFVDPPSFFKDHDRQVKFDINADHPRLLQSVMDVMTPQSIIIFSTNHQRFEPRFDEISYAELKEFTPGTIPEDYRNKGIHRCWMIRRH